MAMTPTRYEHELDELREQRDELVAALTHLLELGRKNTSNPKYDGYYESARAAIAKAEGK